MARLVEICESVSAEIVYVTGVENFADFGKHDVEHLTRINQEFKQTIADAKYVK